MPELPEVEIVVRELANRLVGRRIAQVDVRHTDVWSRGRGLRAGMLKGLAIVGVRRRAKMILLELERDLFLTVHLRMTGWLGVTPRRQPLAHHTHLRIALDGPDEIRFRDPRRFGRVQLVSRPQLARLPFLLRLGPEPFDLRPDELDRRLAQRTGTLKGVLLDQSFVAGLGNIYVDEILFDVGLHPRTVANRVRRPEAERLCKSMCEVLDLAIESGGSTIRDYRSPSEAVGGFQHRHRVFGRDGTPCAHCGTIIRKLRVAGRGTHVCPGCQPYRRRRPRPRGSRLRR